MSVLPILIFPDARLRRKCAPVKEVNSSVRRLADDMIETMYAAPGIGLAAPQVGKLIRLFVMDRTEGEEDDPVSEVLINPEVISVSDETVTREEGCLSLPGHFEDITRPAGVRVKYTGLDECEHVQTFEGVQAVCAQHEIDHLNGKLFIDHLSLVKRSIISRKMRKQKKELLKNEKSGNV